MRTLSVLTCIFCGVLFASCDRRELTYYMESEIEIHADWSHAALDEVEANYGATAIFYPEAGGAPKVVLMGNRETAKVRLPEGRYNVILFNRSFEDFGCIAFRGTEAYGTLEAYASRIETRTEEITDCPEKLAADRIEGFEVTEDMLGNYSEVMKTHTTEGDECVLNFSPRSLIEEMRVTVHIKGLNNVRTAVATINDVAASVFLATGETSQQTVTQRFELGNPQYNPGSPFDGTMTSTFNAFTFNADRQHEVQIQALLTDEKTIFKQDFTGVEVKEETGADDTVILTLELGTEKVPDVKPEGGGGPGFDVDIEGWGDEQEGDISA